MRLQIRGNYDDDARELRRLLSDLGPLHAAPRHQKWRLRLQPVTYLGPGAIAVLSTAVLMGRHLRQAPKVVMPDGPRELLRFCDSCGFTRPVARAQHTAADDWDTMPLEQFATASWTLAGTVVALIQRHVSLSTDDEEVLCMCINEVIQNVEDHAASRVGGVLAARWMGGRGEVRIAVVDRGKGVLESYACTTRIFQAPKTP
ncbi:MAG: hypothetical protein K2Q09_06865 [Phycisphaerales bacterium]|nr:hypothetical protein [Phycisphaerales bacterium]